MPAALFIGREEFLTTLRETLRAERLAVIVGARGVGKTAVAREYARRFASEYQQVLWINATMFSSLLSDALELARQCVLDTLGVAIAGAAESSTAIVRGLCLAEGGNPASILIGDGSRLSPRQAALANGIGQYELPSAATIGAADASFSSIPDNGAISLIDSAASGSYPIINYEYAIVNSGQKDGATAQTLQAFLHWTITDGNNASFLDKVHFQPLPAEVAKSSDAQIVKISGQ